LFPRWQTVFMATAQVEVVSVALQAARRAYACRPSARRPSKNGDTSPQSGWSRVAVAWIEMILRRHRHAPRGANALEDLRQAR